MLNPHFRAILSIFDDENVEYLVVGAYALAADGLPRATGDIDLWIRPTPENARRTCKALARFGAPLSGIEPDDFTEQGLAFQIGVAPNRVDVLTSISGVDTFEEAWPTALKTAMEDIVLPVLSIPLLIQNKRATGRPKDELDVRWLEGKGGQ